MKTLSKTQYENETYLYKLFDIKLFQIGLPSLYLRKAAIYAAKSVQHLVPEKDKEVSLRAIEIGEKYLTGQATKEECKKATEAVHAHVVYAEAPVSAYQGASIDACVHALFAANTNTHSAAHAAVYAAHAVNARDVAFAKYCAYYAYCAAVCAAAYAPSTTSARITACDIFRQAIPWNLVCSFQIAKCFRNEKDEQFIQEITKDEKLINYATILLEDENLRKEFQFFMKDYMNK